MRFPILALCAALATAGCVVKQEPPVSDEAVAQAAFTHDGPPKLTLYTMISNRSGRGAHTSIMINASQRVIFDPAGSFRNENIVSRNDVVYNVTPYMEDTYTRFHARKTYHVIVQELDVPADVAELALQIVQSGKEVPDAMCAHSTSTLLSQLPGVDIDTTWSPKRLAEEFGALPGVTTNRFYEYDDADRFKALEAYDPEKVRAHMNAKGY